MSGDKAPHVVEDYRGVIQLLSDGTVVRSHAEVLPPASFPDVPGVQWKDVVYDAAHGLRPRLYRLRPAVEADNKLPVLVYFHGGGFCLGTFENRHVHACCLRLAAELPAVVLSADYRLAPEHRLPAAIDDGVAVLSWLRGQAAYLPAAAGAAEPWLAESADYARVFVSGESAGANMAHHVAARFGSDDRDQSSALAAPLHVAGCILLTAFFGGAKRTATESDVRPVLAPVAAGRRLERPPGGEPVRPRQPQLVAAQAATGARCGGRARPAPRPRSGLLGSRCSSHGATQPPN